MYLLTIFVRERGFIMSKPYEGSGSIEYLGYEIISLISRGYKEDVDEIISKMEEGKVVHYILDKYQDQLRLLKDNDLYNYNDWEKIFGQQSYITFNSNVSRKMEIVNRETDGLLVLLQIILETVAQREFE